MATTKLHGKNLVMTFGSINLSAASRSFTMSGEADEIDASTRDDLVAGAAQTLVGITTYEWEASGLDITGVHGAIKTIDIGDEDTLTVTWGGMSFAVPA